MPVILLQTFFPLSQMFSRLMGPRLFSHSLDWLLIILAAFPWAYSSSNLSEVRGPGLHVEFSVWISCGFIMLSSLLQCGLLMNFTDDLLTGRWIFSSVLCFLTFKWFFFYSGTSLLILKLLAFKNFRWRFLSRLFLKSRFCEINHFYSLGCWHFVWTPRSWKGRAPLTAAVLTLQDACIYLGICCPLLKASQSCQIQTLVIETFGSPDPSKIFSKGCMCLIFQ